MRNEVPYKVLKFKTRYFKNGDKHVWYKIWEYLRDNGARSRWQIIRDVIDNRCDSRLRHHLFYRGQHSTLFSAMHFANIIRYDNRTKTWYPVAEVDWRKIP